MVERTHTELHGESENPIVRISVTPPDTRKRGHAKAVVEILVPTIRIEDLFIITEKAADVLGKHYPNSDLPSWAQRPTSAPEDSDPGRHPEPMPSGCPVTAKGLNNVGELLLAYTKAIIGLYKIGEDPLGDAVRMVAAGFSVQLVEAVEVQRFGPSPLEGMVGLWTMMKRKERQDEKSGHTGKEGVREGGDPGGGC